MLIAFTAGCASTTVERVKPEEAIDLSGRWNDTDSRLVAEAMMKDLLSRPWLDIYVEKNKRQPAVIVGTVVNRSHEHINVQTFTKDIEKELTNSGLVQFVASSGEREEIREERAEQMIHATEETAKGVGKETGADYMLKGVLNTIQDEEKGTRVIYYQINLEMIDIESNVKVWLGDKKIKKVVEKRRFGF
ncbi:MAG: penicillin-binding protein activator LpoB [Nitrospirae bacterium]|nr:penicillin-binding protein activator LpoB [Nitrospirota bacterium]